MTVEIISVRMVQHVWMVWIPIPAPVLLAILEAPVKQVCLKVFITDMYEDMVLFQ